MNQKLAEIYVDDSLPGGDLLITIKDFDLTPYVGGDLVLTMMVPGRSENQYVSPDGLVATEYDWPISVHQRGRKGYFVVTGALNSKTRNSPHVGAIYDRGRGRTKIAGQINWPAKTKYPRWVDEEQPRTAAPPPPPPKPEAAEPGPQPIEPAAVKQVAPPPPPPPPRNETTAEPDARDDSDDAANKPGKRRAPWLIGMLGSVLVAAGLFVYFYEPPQPLREGETIQKSRDIQWALATASGTLDLASELGHEAAECQAPQLQNGPAFGRIEVHGATLSYERQERGALTSGLADAFAYAMTCGSTVWSGVVSIASLREAPRVTALGDIEIRLVPFEPLIVSIAELGSAVGSPSEWRWHRAPQAAFVLAKAGADGQNIEIMLHDAEATGRAPFELKASDGRLAQGTLVVIPKQN